MAGAGLGHLLRGRLEAGLLRAELGAVLLGELQPVVELAHLGRLGGEAAEVEGGHIGKVHADELPELTAGEQRLLAGLEGLGHIHVEAGLGFVDVGAGAGARRQRLAGGVELGAVGDALGFDEGDLVAGKQQREVGLGEPRGELLAGVGELRLGIRPLGPGLPHGGPQGRLDQGLAHAEERRAAHVVAVGGDALADEVGRGAAQLVDRAVVAEGHLGQQLGLGLGQQLAARLGAGGGGAHGRVVGEGRLPGAGEVEAGRAGGRGQGGAARQAGQQAPADRDGSKAGHGHSSFIEAASRLTSGCTR